MILVLNVGSSSLKFKLFDRSEEVIAEGQIKRTGADFTFNLCSKLKNINQIEENVTIPDFKAGVSHVLQVLVTSGILESVKTLVAVVHRVVHGGDKFQSPTLLTPTVIADLRQLDDVAPLHNPFSLAVIEQLQGLYPGLIQLAAFDTAFHTSITPEKYLYAVPYDYYQRFGLRRFGFHGLSCQFVSEEYTRLQTVSGNLNTTGRIIVCHLGSGCSLTAISSGQSRDTTMGFGPNEGLMMSSRSGDIGPDALMCLIQKTQGTIADVNYTLNFDSGLKGISGYSTDMQELLRDYESNPRAKLAVEMFVNRLRKYLGSYVVTLNGLDGVVFTGGIGQHSPLIRALVCQGLQFLGLSLDTELNANCVEPTKSVAIHALESQVQIWVIPTDEELQLLRNIQIMLA